MYSCLVTAVTEYHKLAGLKQQKFILSQFLRPEVKNLIISWAMLPAFSREGDSAAAFDGPLPLGLCLCVPTLFIMKLVIVFRPT